MNCWKTCRTSFWIFQVVPQKKKYGGTWHVTMLPKVPFCAYPLALALWSDLAGSNHPACPHGDTIQQTLGRNARPLEGPSHHFLNNREHFQAACSQTKFRISASKKISRDLAFKTILGITQFR